MGEQAMLNDLLTPFVRTWADVTSGVHAPLGFRVVVQPIVASFFAIRAGLRDAREGRPPYFRALLNDPGRRWNLVREGCAHVGKIFIAAVVIDVIYQAIVLRWSIRAKH
jgi:hypothetical protein